ncbi:MAG: rRNA pseudouridine synthase [Acidobacteria bacterium]|nr:rRNA pseudouridine synthase [Acidobacteriota bacterium]
MLERLQKIISAAGIASRRKAEELILSGVVTVNGKAVTELGSKADPESDHIKVNGKLINPGFRQREKVYLLLNKPLGILTSKSDPKNRPLVIDLVGAYRSKVHPVGRLDFNSEGLLLLTNDGEFTNLITHASKQIPKIYEVKVKGQPDESLIRMLERGVPLEGKKTAPARIRQTEQSPTNSWYEVTLFEGRNQQIRKMFDHIGHSVIKLRRIAIGFLRNERLKPGEFRKLDESEVKKFFSSAKPVKQQQKKKNNTGQKSEKKPSAKSSK